MLSSRSPTGQRPEGPVPADLGPPTPGRGDDPISVIVAVVALVLLAPFIVVVIVAGAEFLLLLPFAILGRMLLGRHWTLEVRRGWRPWWETAAGDWQASTLKINDVADAIRSGQLPPQTIGQQATSR